MVKEVLNGVNNIQGRKDGLFFFLTNDAWETGQSHAK